MWGVLKRREVFGGPDLEGDVFEEGLRGDELLRKRKKCGNLCRLPFLSFFCWSSDLFLLVLQ